MIVYKKHGYIVINGKKKTVFRKIGSTKNYINYKNKKMGLTNYKRIIKNKMKNKMKKYKRGGGEKMPIMNDDNINQYMLGVSAVNNASIVETNPMDGGKRYKKKSKKSKKS